MYENVTYEKILARMLARVPDGFDKREGSLIWDSHSPTAIELQLLYFELDSLLQETYGDTASREFLILRCRERGIFPYEATKAVLRGVFVPTNIDVTGRRFNIGDINYVAVEKISDGEYRMECETVGETGNQFLGLMAPIEYIQGLQKAELTEVLIPGEDEEKTEDLRKRYFTSFDEKAFGGNVADYIEKTNAIPGVGKTKVTRLWNGDIRPAEMIPTDAVKNWYDEIKGTVESEVKHWIDMVYRAATEKKLTIGGTILLTIINSEFSPASDALIQSVQNTIDPEENAGEGYGLAPIGHMVMVKSAMAVEVYIKSTLTFDTGYGWGNLQSSIETAISEYLLEMRKEWADSSYLIVRTSQVNNRLLSVSGIVDVQNTFINGVEENLILGEYEIPVFGGVSE